MNITIADQKSTERLVVPVHSEDHVYQTHVYLHGLNYMFRLNTLNNLTFT
jgi:hypothetical protein